VKNLKSKTFSYKYRGFTFVELIVASIIGVFITVVAVGVLKAVSTGAEMVNDGIDKSAGIKYVSGMIAADLWNVYRGRNFADTKFIGTMRPGSEGRSSSLTFYTVGSIKARSEQPEGDIYEVEYYLNSSEEKTSLMRRLWPNPDKENRPGGILTAIADDVDSFFVRYYDGQQWQTQWDEMKSDFPELVEVIIASGASSGEKPLAKSFFVNFASSSGSETDAFETENETDNETKNEPVAGVADVNK